jgi:hypothetical protein
MSTSIQEQDLIQTIKELQQRISDLERQQRTIATSTGVNVKGDTIGLGGAITGPNAKGMELAKDYIRLFTNNPAGDITAQIDITWDAWLGSVTIPFLSTLSFVSVPATATSTGTVGQFAANTTHLYICVNTNTWRRVAIGTF